MNLLMTPFLYLGRYTTMYIYTEQRATCALIDAFVHDTCREHLPPDHTPMLVLHRRLILHRYLGRDRYQ